MVYSQGQELNVKFDVNIIVQFQPRDPSCPLFADAAVDQNRKLDIVQKKKRVIFNCF